jgi:hypothetical protein
LIYKFEGRKRVSEKWKQIEPLVADFEEEEEVNEPIETLSDEETKKIQTQLDEEFGVKQGYRPKIDIFDNKFPKVRFSDVVESLDNDEVKKVEKNDPIKNDIQNEKELISNEPENQKLEQPLREEPKSKETIELEKILEDEETFNKVLRAEHEHSKVNFFHERFPEFSKEELKKILEIKPDDRYAKMLENALEDTEKTVMEALDILEDENKMNKI